MQTILLNPFFYLTGLLLLAAWCFLRPFKKEQSVFVVEKIGIPPKNSSLKKEWISPTKLEKKLTYFLQKKYTFLTPDKLQTPHPKKSVLLMFMGGYRSFYTIAFPLLQKYNIPATVFIAPDLIGAHNAWQDPYKEPWQDLLTTADINELKKNALISWGALPLGGQKSTACSHEQADFILKESIYRLEKQFGISLCAWSVYPDAPAAAKSLHLLPIKK